ncbi:hypothetical protein [Nocardia otitidiscaviarum]|uniref:hypothetical protein n=1 Tax=Nocardia otitidiscaviarum TaxID=1823 RepID=UPI0018941BBB|nr:hypothetical protein [Nocardia otitidiscaviarum]MBF6181957.1 hypothetical protein [Nocardia otitidiscaviarum]
MSVTPIQPRALTDLECGVIAKLLATGRSGAQDYLRQIPDAQVVATWGIGSPSVDVVVPADVVAASDSTDGIFASGAVTDSAGAPIGEVTLWVEHGRLSGIEYAWYTDERPPTLPEPSQIEVL